jgi:hypothetical protein
MTESGVTRSQVIGFVHNHPDHYYGQTNYDDAINRYPSDADWGFAEWMVNGGAGGTNGEGFALYQIDTEGNMREFEYKDRAMYQDLTPTQRENGRDLPSKSKNDGSSCG